MKTETKVCEIHGEYIAEYVGFGGFHRWSKCPACDDINQARIAELNAKQEEAERRFRISENMLHSGVPKKYLKASLTGIDIVSDKHAKAIQYASRYISAFHGIKDDGVSMIFFGSPGTGKTHIACAIAIEIINQGFAAKYTTAFDLLNEISDCFRTKEPTQDVIKKYIHADLLIIDEIGIQYGKDHDSIWLYKIINTRYVNNRPTIIISNLSQEDLEAFIGAPTYDRLQEGKGAAIPFYWDSFRRKNTMKLAS